MIGSSWTEGGYGVPSAGRLQLVSAEVDPAIRLIRETPAIVDAFSPLDYVPTTFLYDTGGKLAVGDGERDFLSKDLIRKLVAGLK